MALEYISPVGRFVQGSISLETKMDQQTGKPKLDENGQPIKEMFFALAVRKDAPGLNEFYQLFVAAARADFPHLFNAQGQCTHPQFAWKIQDGDGVDNSGKSVADKPGFAGHYIFKMGTRFLPKCFHHGKYDPTQQIQNPNEVIKRGYFVRVSGTIRGNGVTPQDRTNKPGLFVSPNLIELVAFGEEIVGGPDAAKVFGGAPAITALPPGASQTPLVGGPGAAPMGGLPGPGATPLQAPGAVAGGLPGLPGTAAAPAAAGALPALPGAAVTPGALPSLPGAPGALPAPGPRYVIRPDLAAQGYSVENLKAQNWTEEALIRDGYMVLAA